MASFRHYDASISVSPTPEQFEIIKGKRFAGNFYFERSKKLRSGALIVPEFGRIESGQRDGWIWFDNYDGCPEGETLIITIMEWLPGVDKAGPKLKKLLKSAIGMQLTAKVIASLDTVLASFTTPLSTAKWPFFEAENLQVDTSDKSKNKPAAKKIVTKSVVKN